MRCWRAHTIESSIGEYRCMGFCAKLCGIIGVRSDWAVVTTSGQQFVRQTTATRLFTVGYAEYSIRFNVYTCRYTDICSCTRIHIIRKCVSSECGNTELTKEKTPQRCDNNVCEHSTALSVRAMR